MVANRTLGSGALHGWLRTRIEAAPDSSFYVIAPVRSVAVTPLDVGGVAGGITVYDGDTQQLLERDARERLDGLLSWFDEAGVVADGTVVVGDPLQAILRRLRDQPFDEVVVFTVPGRWAQRLRMDLVQRIRRKVTVPVEAIEVATNADGPPEGDEEGHKRALTVEPSGTEQQGRGMAESVYKFIELVGTSTESWEKAATAAVNTASQSLRDLRVAEIAELDLVIEDGAVAAYRAKIKVSFKYEGGDREP